jgi:hypothetical protein
VTELVRLVTTVELRHYGGGHDSYSALHEAVLADGSRVTVLDDRGWSGSSSDGRDYPIDPEEIDRTARFVVGPDEPYGDETQQEAEDSYWAYLARILESKGVTAGAEELRQLPHDVVFGERLAAHLEEQG